MASCTRHLIIEHDDFLSQFLNYLIQRDVIDTPLSLERRGIILYEFCKQHYPTYLIDVTIAWVEAGMSLKKAPAAQIRTKQQTPPEQWNVIKGEYKESLRLCFLPISNDMTRGYWFGFESDTQKATPVFKASYGL